MSRDPGLQPERTRLAWWRTALTVGVVALLTVRMSFPLGPAAALPIAAALLAWVTGMIVTYREEARTSQRRPAAPGRSLLVVGGLTAAYAALGVALVATSLG